MKKIAILILLFSNLSHADNQIDVNKALAPMNTVTLGMLEGINAVGKGIAEALKPQDQNGIMNQRNIANKHEKIWIAGKPLKECMGTNKKIDNNVIQCHYGYFQ